MVRLDRFPRRNNTHVNRHQAGQTSWQQWVHEQCPGWHMDRDDRTIGWCGEQNGFPCSCSAKWEPCISRL